MMAPPILMLDEPTASLDVRSARAFLARLREWAAECGTTLLVVTHRPDDVLELEAEAAVLLGGHLYGPYALEAWRSGEVAPAVHEFLGSLVHADDGAVS